MRFRPHDQQFDRSRILVNDPGAAAAVLGRDLSKSYGERLAVAGIDFSVPVGSCFGFLGPNGAGKTTTMRMIYGLSTPDGGSLEVLGRDVVAEPREVKAGIGVVAQETNLDAELTLREGLVQQASFFGIGSAEGGPRADQLLEFAQLADRAAEYPRQLSGGMKRRLLIARALVADPDLIVLDEPTTGLDPQARLAVWEALDQLRREGVTLVITTHYMDEAERLCDRLVIMDEGSIVAEGKPAELIADHVGAEVLELRPTVECDEAGLLESLEGSDVRSTERGPGTLLLFVDDAEAVLARHDHDRFPLESALARRATLEDVFLKLTGRSLRE